MATPAMIEKLTAEGPGEQAKFLNDIVGYLWPNINVAGSKIIKDTVNPMFKTMLPAMINDLHFTKVDLGTVPLVVDKVLCTKTETGGIKLDMNVKWDGNCDIELDGGKVPKLGVKSVHMTGRLSVLMGPLTNVIPLIGAVQIAFINPPHLQLDFTGAANVADFSMIDGYVRKTIITVLNSILTLPNRILVKLDVNTDYFATYLEPIGVIRITVDKAYGFAEESKGKMKKLFSKITRAAPDCYTGVQVGAEPEWHTAVKNNTVNPVWEETHDFVVTDFDQSIQFAIEDQDVGGDDEVGTGITTVEEILRAGGRMELPLFLKDEAGPGKIAVRAEFFKFESEPQTLSAQAAARPDQMVGFAVVLIAGAFDIKGDRKALHPSVKVTWGADKKNHFQTAIQSDYPGADINNPTFDTNFRIPITSDLISGGQPFRIALFDGEKEVGGVDVPFAEVQKAPKMTLANKFDVGSGAQVRASISLRGMRPAAIEEVKKAPQQQSLASRPKA